MKWATPFRVLVLLAGLVAALMLLMPSLGYRFGWWQFRTGIAAMRWAFYAGLVAGALAIIALAIPKVRARWSPALLLVLALGIAAAYVPWQWQQNAGSVPRIHDISTDTDNPPQFVAVVPLRTGAENPPAYAGSDVAQLQKKAYPEIQPLELAVPPQVAFTRARDAVQRMGWEMVAADAAAGRIEATDTTRFFGFKDDVVIRITPAGAGSRVDVRSKSRVGRSDLGVNAKRIREFLTTLRSQA